MKGFLILFALTLIVLSGGCAVDRIIEISVPRNTVSSGVESADLTPTVAESLFRGLAAQLVFKVRGPVLQMGNSGVITNLTAISQSGSPVAGYMEVFIYEKGTTFHCVSDNSRKAEEIALQFEQALDQKGIRFTVTKTTANPLND